MRFDHHIEVAAPPERVWEFLWLVDRVGACLPGCREVRTVEPLERYEATIEERVGPFKARFDWEIAVEERQPLQQIRLIARGKDRKLGATARAEMAVLLSGRDGGGTTLDIKTDLSVTGKVATLGGVVIRRKADAVVNGFAEALRLELERPRT